MILIIQEGMSNRNEHTGSNVQSSGILDSAVLILSGKVLN